MDKKILELNDIIAVKDYKINDNDQVLCSLNLQVQTHEALIGGLNVEKEHLNLSLVENQKMKEQYKKRGDEMLKKYNTCFDELSLIL
jgi:hypothetical protein